MKDEGRGMSTTSYWIEGERWTTGRGGKSISSLALKEQAVELQVHEKSPQSTSCSNEGRGKKRGGSSAPGAE